MSKYAKWFVLALISLAAFSVALAQAGTRLYFPLVYKQPTPTPTATATPTNTPTPTQTATPKVSPTPTLNVFIDEIEPDPVEDPLDEYVDIRNSSGTSVDMEGWILRDDGGNIFTFPDFTLANSGTVRVRSGTGTNTSSTLFWGRTQEDGDVWNDVSDCAYLRDGLGGESKMIDSHCYPPLPLWQRLLELLP